MTREEAIKEIESNIKAYVVEVAMSDGLHVHLTKICNINCPYFSNDKHDPMCGLFNEQLKWSHERLPQCLAIKQEYEYVAINNIKTKE